MPAADGSGPEQVAVLADAVGLAVLVVLDNLTPPERVALVLHDMFAVPFDEIGRVLDRNATAGRARGMQPALVDGRPAAVWMPRGRLRVIFGFVVEGDAIAAIQLVAAPEKLEPYVCAQYASLPRTPDARGTANILGAVAAGGTLLVVGHDIEPMRAVVDDPTLGSPFDPDAYVRVDDFVAALRDADGWEVELYEKRPRPPGAATASHHVDDVVLRARRESGPASVPAGALDCR